MRTELKNPTLIPSQRKPVQAESDDNEMSQLDLNHFGVDQIHLTQLNSPDGQKYNRIGHWYYGSHRRWLNRADVWLRTRRT